MAYPWSEVLAFPLLHGSIGFEIIQVLEIKALIFAVELCRTFLTALDNGINVIIDDKSDRQLLKTDRA